MTRDAKNILIINSAESGNFLAGVRLPDTRAAIINIITLLLNSITN
jgi:hypothetical protein